LIASILSLLSLSLLLSSLFRSFVLWATEISPRCSFLRRRSGVGVSVLHRRRLRGVLFRGFLQLRRDPGAAFLRAVSRVVTVLAARAALGVLRLRAVSSEVTFLVAVSALVPGFRRSRRFFLVRSRVRLGAISRPVTGLAAAVADIFRASRAAFARLSRASAASAAAAVLRARSRVVPESTADATRVVASAAASAAGKSASAAAGKPASIRRRTKPRHVAKPAASVTSHIVHRWRSRIRQRAVSRPVAKVSASVALVVGGRASRVPAATAFVVVPSRAASVVIRTVARPVLS
jgi:hypothetical protein